MDGMTDASLRPPPAAADLEGVVCWTRMQAEAGQTLDAIVARKEIERRAGGGLFLWGVGSAPATAIAGLARDRIPVPVVFSVMKGRPRAADASPSRVLAWRRWRDADGRDHALPPAAIVTSRGDDAGTKRTHYALVCRSTAPLSISRGIPFHHAVYRNVGGAGAPVGASQVTALLRRTADASGDATYEIGMTAWLDGGLWIRLCDPVVVTAALACRLRDATRCDEADWLRLAADMREGASAIPPSPQASLAF